MENILKVLQEDSKYKNSSFLFNFATLNCILKLQEGSCEGKRFFWWCKNICQGKECQVAFKY